MRKVLMVALPIVIQNLVSASLHIIDGVMIGQLGDAPYAAVTQANRYTFVFQLFLFGTGSGCGIFFSQYWGKRDVAAMRRVMGLCLRFALLLAAAFAGMAVFATETVVSLFLPRGDSFNDAVRYLRIVAPGYLFAAVDIAYASCLKSAEKTSIPMVAGVVSILLNTLLNYLLIYGKCGLPALGVQGAALATVISGGVAMTINLVASYSMKLPSAARLRDMTMPDKAYLKRFVRLVAPVVVNEGLWSMGMSMYNVFYGRLGDASVAAVGIAGTVDQLVHVMVYGVMNATAILVGGCLGAGDRDGAWLIAKRMLMASQVIGVVMGVILLCGRNAMLGIFNVSQEARSLASIILLIGSFTIWLRAFNSVNVVGILRAGGDTVFSMLLDTAALWLIGVPLVGLAALVWRLPVWQVYMFTITEEAIKAAIGLRRFRSGKWMSVLTDRG
ncbi:MAG: MATE family efflux transporter [Aristaeellaceae bacterium]